MADQSGQVLDAPLPSAAVALNRFGLGARPDDMPPKDPKGWLRDQLEVYEARPPMIAALPNSETIAIPYFQSRRQANNASDAEAKQAIFAASRSDHRRVYRAAVRVSAWRSMRRALPGLVMLCQSLRRSRVFLISTPSVANYPRQAKKPF